jgi:hypothetical protein
MIWIHPGVFFTGDKQADDMVALCDSFARPFSIFTTPKVFKTQCITRQLEWY